MTVIFEARELYDAAKDAVSRVTLKVELHPGQVEEIKAFLAGIASKAGVYFAEIEHAVVQEARAAIAAVESVIEPAEQQEPEQPAPEAQPSGETNGEQPIQHADSDGPGKDDGREGRDADQGSAAKVGIADAGGELARVARKSRP